MIIFTTKLPIKYIASLLRSSFFLGVLFSVYNHSKSMGTRFLGEIARKHQSYHGTQIALDAYLENMLNLQPTAFHLRMFIPLFMIQLGDDDRAYNFIKFWVKITPFQVKKSIDHFMFSFILRLVKVAFVPESTIVKSPKKCTKSLKESTETYLNCLSSQLKALCIIK